MGENKLWFFLTKKQESIITEHLLNIKSSEDTISWVLDMLKNHILIAHGNMPGLKQSFEITEEDISNQPLDQDKEFKIEGASMKVIDLAGPVLIQQIEYCGKFQCVLNQKEDQGRKVFKTFEEYLNDLIRDNINQLTTINLGKILNDELTKTKQKLPKKIPEKTN